MTLSQNRIWIFFASTKLTLFSLILLATTSIIGTFIEQQKEQSYYIDKYGATSARFFELLDFTQMYTSWWFVSLLLLFALNLVVCSIERLPGVWRTVVRRDPQIDCEQLRKMASSHSITVQVPVTKAAGLVQEVLADHGWKKIYTRHTGDSASIFVQQGSWTRLAVYVVHLSILLILAGALIGAFFGFKAYVYLPEGRSTDKVFLQNNREPVELGFQLRGDSFRRTFYANGMVRQHHADLTVLDPSDREPYRKSIFVNDPLSHRGISFYLGDSKPLEQYFVVIGNRETGEEHAFRVPPNQDFTWGEEGVTAHIGELVRDSQGFVHRARIRLSADAAAPPAELWIDNNGTATTNQAGQTLTVSFRQLSSVLLLVKKDPGVGIVFVGFTLMTAGLFVSFFLAHRRIWVHLSPTKKGAEIVLGGSANKNKPSFARAFQKIALEIERRGGGR